jgi:hypothetical protein
MSGKTGSIADAGEAFARDTASHEMTVLRDDGLYRHLRFQRTVTQEDGTRKASSFYWFDLVTWPGCLAVNGDMESFLFSRVEDMFEFFRGHQSNPSYWAEKIRAGAEIKRYSEEQFREHVLDYFKDEVQYGSAPKGIGRAIREEVLGADEIAWEDGARQVLRDFRYRPPGSDPDSAPWQFMDTWEWDLRDYTHQFLWCCHAIPWGIAQWDAARAVKA